MEYVDFKIKYTADEMYQYEKNYLFKKYFGLYRGWAGIIIAAALAYFMVIAFQQGIQSVSAIALIVFGTLLIAFIVVLIRVLRYRLTYKDRYKNSEILEKETRIILSLNGEYPENIGDTLIYEEALDYFETTDLYVIEVGDEKGRRALIIPKRYAYSETKSEFVKDCAARMIKNRKERIKNSRKKRK